MGTFLFHARVHLNSRRSMSAAVLAALAGAFGQAANAALCVVEGPQKLLPAIGAAGDRFGHSVAIGDSFLAVGAYRDDDACASGSGCNSGSVHIYIYHAGAWAHSVELKPVDIAAGDNFGRAVAVGGDTLVVGSPLDDDAGSASGSVYIFVRGAGGVWTQQAKLRAADAAAGDSFGDAVAIQGDTVVVGALLDDNARGANAGSAYVFTRAGSAWTQTATMIAADGAANDNFGCAVAVDGDSVLVGAENDDDPLHGLNAGSAYVFLRAGATWNQQAKITDATGDRDELFGWEVAIDGDTAAITSLEDDDQGGVHVFTRADGVWTFQQRVVSDDVSTFDEFGFAIAMRGDRLLVGCAYDDDACPGNPPFCDSGAAYLFERTGGQWNQSRKFSPVDVVEEDEFGYAVAMNDTFITVGARMHDQAGTDAGAAYVFSLSCAESCAGDLNFDGFVNLLDSAALFGCWSAGPESGADLTSDGIVDVMDLFALLSAWGPCAAS